MNIKLIRVLSLPALLLACGGTNGSADLTAPRDDGRPRAPEPGAAAPANNSGTPDVGAVDAQQLLQAQVASAVLSLDEATSVALAANPGSQVLEADLDGDSAAPRFEIELLLGDGSVLEVHVDATSGEILGTFPEDDDADDDDDDDENLDCTGAISAVEAQELAEAEAGGTAVEVEIDDGCEFEVTVDTGAGFVEIELAPDGTIVQVENDDDDLDDDDGDDDLDDDDDDDDDDLDDDDDDLDDDDDDDDDDADDDDDGDDD